MYNLTQDMGERCSLERDWTRAPGRFERTLFEHMSGVGPLPAWSVDVPEPGDERVASIGRFFKGIGPLKKSGCKMDGMGREIGGLKCMRK